MALFPVQQQLDSDMELTFGYQVHKNIYTYLGYWGRSDQFGGSDFTFGGWFHGTGLGTVFVFKFWTPLSGNTG